MIATLATLAALGRDAFVAIPDVKPITAIVLVSGIAFGAGPGFAVGAISALASNILLGQGPWTPWQMLGWGLVGLIGAGVGSLTQRRMSPLAIAISCALAAVMFNLVMDLYTWTGAGSHTLAAFGVVLGSSLVFDATHVVASFVFGLAFGAALLRMLLRVRSRLQVAWEPLAAPSAPASPPSLPVVSLILAALLAASVLANPGSRAVAAANPQSGQLSYLQGAQNTDGGFGAAAGQSSTELYSAWAAIGFAAAGRDPLGVRRGGHNVLDAMRAQAGTLRGAGDLERTILALRACGVSTHSLGGVDPVAKLLRLRSPDGSFEDLGNLTAFGILALRAAGYPASYSAVRSAVRWLEAQQEGDGGFGFAVRGSGSDVDDTAAAAQAIVAAGGAGQRTVARAAAFLQHAQNLDGGFPEQPGGTSNAQSTAWAVQGLVAAGRNVSRITRAGGRSPLGYLQSLIMPDGSVRYSRTGSQTPVWVTAQALTALARRPFPIAPVAGRAHGAVARPVVVATVTPRHVASPHAAAARPAQAGEPPAARRGRGDRSDGGRNGRAAHARAFRGALAIEIP